ncbi:MAG: hypothetical protein V2I56_11870 [Desulfobacteraceae bacterium]|jgi:hypothetical protein|nr:hypothetical protein [Desulfobacteraceae bacterium]
MRIKKTAAVETATTAVDASDSTSFEVIVKGQTTTHGVTLTHLYYP